MCDSWSRCVISRSFIESVDSFIFFKGDKTMKNKQLLENILDNSKIFLKNNSSTLLTIGASVGMVLTVVSTTKATIKAVEIYNEIEVEKKKTYS